MQRVISYIAFLENTIKFLCWQLGSKPHPSWVLLTDNFSNYFRDYFKGIEGAIPHCCGKYQVYIH